ncbi:EXS-domain-containing protein [Trametopsis cervina]|nr:EXS-domain-containing protein [Trametopsis cervina]
MKFARYLEDTQIPEWKRAYIDYRGLKKCIAAIRIAQERTDNGSTPLLHPGSHGSRDAMPSARVSLAEVSEQLENSDRGSLASSSHNVQEIPDRRSAASESGSNVLTPASPHRLGVIRTATLNMGFLPKLVQGKSSRNAWEPSAQRTKSSALQWDLARSIPLKDLMPLLSPVQRAFFEKLDKREKEMRSRTIILKAQLQELQEHRRIFHEAEANSSWLPLKSRKVGSVGPHSIEHLPARNYARKRRSYKVDTDSTRRRPQSLTSETKKREQSAENSSVPLQHENSDDATLQHNNASGSGSSGGSGTEDGVKGWKKLRHSFQRDDPSKKPGPSTSPDRSHARYDPDEYAHAKKSLKKAVLECYRGLEVLENYRTLNLIGFRKALKKFEKIAKIPAQQAYFAEKIEPSTFSSKAPVQGMVDQMEDLYAARFTRGDRKVAKARLRGGNARQKSRHFSAFRSGLLLGIALPAFVDAIYLSFQPETRQAIPGHDGLLYVYSVFLIPILFLLLVGVNVLGWHAARINYVFIFEFDLKTKVDHREFFEFSDFWMGDQYCSLIYPLSNLYLVACAYSGGLDHNWSKCLSPRPWGVPFILASLPLLIRLVQSVKRWVDSKLVTHLINGGKYGAGILYYLAYYNWRHHGGDRGVDFVLWCVAGTVYAIYASAWDFLMDWSVLRPHAKYPLLRDNILYTNHIPLYYFAIVSNVFIRFIWVIYIPKGGLPFPIRTFIAAMLEMLRRWQWNFYRLENEHLGNVDQYRVTREVPLPYSFDDAGHETEGDEDDKKSISSWRSRRRAAKAQASSDVYKVGTDAQS